MSSIILVGRCIVTLYMSVHFQKQTKQTEIAEFDSSVMSVQVERGIEDVPCTS